MAIAREQTRDTQTRWAIELYPFSPKWPGTIDANQAQPVSIVTADKDKASFALEIQQSINAGSSTQSTIDVSSDLVNGGLKAVRISRTKTRVDAQCTFQVQGWVPLACFPGSWVIITSVRTNGDGTENKLIRFIGQIYDMQPREVVMGNGAVVTSTAFHVREWSAALAMPVRYDLFAIVNSLPQTSSVSAITNILSNSNTLSPDEMQQLGTKTFNPFELAHLILQLIGAMNANDRIDSLAETAGIQLPEVALKMPSIPPTLLKRLGLNDVDNKNPFSSGFAKIITGVQTVPVNNDGTWNGIFDSINNDYAIQLNKSPPDRPIVLGMAALMAQGKSAWQLISEYCDPALNEFYTDILYELRDDGVSVRAQPVIVLRDKPFLLSKTKASLTAKAQLDSWTLFDNLPRLALDSAYVTSFSRSNTFINSPNYFRTNFTPLGSTRDGIPSALAQTKGTQLLIPERDQYGGQEHFIETNFLSQDVIRGDRDKFNADWFQQILYVNMAWHSQNYRMVDGTLTLKDDNFPIAIGMNVQFNWGVNQQWTIVGHVEGVDLSFKIDDRGIFTTDTEIKLTRIVQLIQGSLDFIPPEAMANLYYAGAAPSPTSTGTGLLDLNLTDLANQLTSGLGLP